MRSTDSLTIPGLISAEFWRRLSRKTRSSPLYSWRYSSQIPGSVKFTPTDLRPADGKLAKEFYAGRYTFAETTACIQSKSPFAVKPPNAEWFSQLHSFRWLRHMREANTNLIQASTGILISDWIEQWGHQINSKAYSSEIAAARLISWLTHAPLKDNNISSQNLEICLKSIGKHIRYLQSNAPYSTDGYPRLLTTIALAYASLCLPSSARIIDTAAQNLDKELNRQIFPDGGHVSRNPGVLIKLLADLLPLSLAYVECGYSPSPVLLSATDKMMRILQFFRHSNGNLAQFNGTGRTPDKLLETILSFHEAKTSGMESAPYCGFERLAAQNTVVLIDTGVPQSANASQSAMAGTLSFELSNGNNRLVSNCGAPECNLQLYIPYARATAAHSTATVGDTSSSHFAGESKFEKLLPSPLITFPKNITVKREADKSSQSIIASHDGYLKKFNIIHFRRLTLSNDGKIFSGIDQFTTSDHQVPPSTIITIRFHLPPTISASPLSSGQSVLIAAPNGDAWAFNCKKGTVKLEESIQFSGPGRPRKSSQIVIHINPAEHGSIQWSFEHRKKPPKSNSKKTQSKDITPDFLDQLKPESN